jgi:isoleucyl-tRNA synthetase
VLHDGPPYANGATHLGHSVNKVLKDIITRYQLLQGNRVHYVPGWDCHGLPIEQKVTAQFPGKSPAAISPIEMRPAARQYALKQASSQREEFKLLGIMADWSQETTYRTLDADYERNQLRIFQEMVKRNLITRAIKPVYWSPSSQTALAEAEVVHDPNHQSRSIYVRYSFFPGPSLKEVLKDNPEALQTVESAAKGSHGISAVIWTTTPWSLTANMALTANPDLSYSLVSAKEAPCQGEVFLVATDRLAAFEKVKVGLADVHSKERPRTGPMHEIARFPGSALLDSTYRHPFLPRDADNRPILGASYVTSVAGTGLVHCAPAHGADDYNTWQEYCQQNAAARKEVYINAADHNGAFSEEVEELVRRDLDLNMPAGFSLLNMKVLGSGGKDLVRTLDQDGWVLSEQPLQHTYPYDWRSNQPLIIRATPQWFVNVEKIKDRAIAALDNVRFVPESAKAKLELLVRSRNEWCISRQRTWGVPIPVLFREDNGEPLLSLINVQHIVKVLSEKGTDYWWFGDADEFVAPQEQKKGVRWVKGTDTMDVWFDSGTSWSLLPGAKEQSDDPNVDFTSPVTPSANVYLEGTDQHRGWFQSSLLTHVAVSSLKDDPVAPFQTLISHAFTVDRKGDKMSKSKANVISPQFFLLGGPKNKQPAFGADPLRWWVARVDFTSDIIVSPLAIRHASDELRKIRNTLRFLLAYVPLPHEVPPFNKDDLDFTEQYMMHTLRDLSVACKAAYDNYDFAQVTRRVTGYANTIVSSFYIVNVKDSLYADAEDNEKRQAAVVVLDHIFKTLLSAVAPFAPHLAEEVWHFYKGALEKPEPEAKEVAERAARRIYQPVERVVSSPPRSSEVRSSESYFTNSWHVVPELEGGEQIKQDMMVILRLRTSIQSRLEEVRQMKQVKSSLGTQIKLLLPKQSKVAEIIERRKGDLSRIFQMASCHIVDELPPRVTTSQEPNPVWPCLGFCEDTEVDFAIEQSTDEECPRCRQFIRKKEDSVCHRCDEILTEMLGGEDWDRAESHNENSEADEENHSMDEEESPSEERRSF